jgi:type IV pilus assembly protein PilV
MHVHTESAVPAGREAREAGFTLIEVMVAMVVLAVGLLAVAYMQVSAIEGNTVGWRNTEALVWAGDQIERLMALPYEAPDLDPTDPDVPETAHAVSQGQYALTWHVISNVAGATTLSQTKTIQLEVGWNDHGDGKSIRLAFIKANI